MPDKSFEHVIPFHHVQPQNIWLPLVTVTLIPAQGPPVDLPLLVDTGASVTTLPHDLYALLGVPAWDSGQPVATQTAGGPVPVYQYQANLEFLGKTVACPIQLNSQIPQHPLFVGLFGRETIFEQFGFGFWESAHEIYITLNP